MEDQVFIEFEQEYNTTIRDRLWVGILQRNNTAIEDGLFSEFDLVYNKKREKIVGFNSV